MEGYSKLAIAQCLQLRHNNHVGRLNVTEKSEMEMMSRRRAFSILGLAALSMAMSPTVLTVSEAEAQQPSTQTPQTGTTTTPQTGTQRREERREGRTERRQERRTARTELRQARRIARTERRHERREARDERRTERTTGRADRRQQRNGTNPPTSSTPQQQH